MDTPKTYLILAGTWRDSDDTVKHPGATIQLADDVAQAHLHNLQPLDSPPDLFEQPAT